MISEKKGAFWNPKSQHFHRNRGSFKVKVRDSFNMENTDGLHKFPVNGVILGLLSSTHLQTRGVSQCHRCTCTQRLSSDHVARGGSCTLEGH